VTDAEAPEKWCPSCKEAMRTVRETCPVCLADLEIEQAGDIECSQCGGRWPATMDSCPRCFAAIGSADQGDRVDDGMVRLLTNGRAMIRPARFERFRDGPSVALARFGIQGSLVLTGRDHLIEAYVETPDNKAVLPMECRDVTGERLFRVGKYEAAPLSLVAYDADDTPLAIYQRHENPSSRSMLVRDETSAPAARLQPSTHERFDYELVETGGPVVAGVSVHDEETADRSDDVWALYQVGQRIPFKLYGTIGILLAAKLFFGRTMPAVRSKPSEADDVQAASVFWHLFE
jgi:hypothetical protein